MNTALVTVALFSPSACLASPSKFVRYLEHDGKVWFPIAEARKLAEGIATEGRVNWGTESWGRPELIQTGFSTLSAGSGVASVVEFRIEQK